LAGLKHFSTKRKNRAAPYRISSPLSFILDLGGMTRELGLVSQNAKITHKADIVTAFERRSLDLNARLRDPSTGGLDANIIAGLLGISRADIARLCGVSEQRLTQTPADSGIQTKLQPLEDVAQALHWCEGNAAKLHAWLNRPNRDFPVVNGKIPSPIELILGGHAELVAQVVHNLRTGHPS
jgi:hypothetical protein